MFLLTAYGAVEGVFAVSTVAFLTPADVIAVRAALWRWTLVLIPAGLAAGVALYRLHASAFASKRRAWVTALGCARLFVVFVPMAFALMAVFALFVPVALLVAAFDKVWRRFGGRGVDAARLMPNGIVLPFIYWVLPMNGLEGDKALRALFVKQFPFWIVPLAAVVWIFVHPTSISDRFESLQLLGLSAFWVGDAVVMWLAVRDGPIAEAQPEPARWIDRVTRPLRYFDQAEDAVIAGGFAALYLLFVAASADASERLTSLLRSLVFVPGVALAGAGLYRFHHLWLTDEDREGLRLAVGIPRLMGHFFFFGFFGLFSMLLVLPARLLDTVFRWTRQHVQRRRLRGDVPRGGDAVAGPGPLASLVTLPLWFLFIPIDRYAQSSGWRFIREGPQWHMFLAAIIFAPVVVAATTAIAVATERADPVLLSLLLTFWVADYATVLFVMARLRPRAAADSASA